MSHPSINPAPFATLDAEVLIARGVLFGIFSDSEEDSPKFLEHGRRGFVAHQDGGGEEFCLGPRGCAFSPEERSRLETNIAGVSKSRYIRYGLTC